jgi:hypothetical protein
VEPDAASSLDVIPTEVGIRRRSATPHRPCGAVRCRVLTFVRTTAIWGATGRRRRNRAALPGDSGRRTGHASVRPPPTEPSARPCASSTSPPRWSRSSRRAASPTWSAPWCPLWPARARTRGRCCPGTRPCCAACGTCAWSGPCRTFPAAARGGCSRDGRTRAHGSPSSTRRTCSTGRADPTRARTAATGRTTPCASPPSPGPRARSPSTAPGGRTGAPGRPTWSTSTTGRRASRPRTWSWSEGPGAGRVRPPWPPSTTWPSRGSPTPASCPRSTCRPRPGPWRGSSTTARSPR